MLEILDALLVSVSFTCAMTIFGVLVVCVMGVPWTQCVEVVFGTGVAIALISAGTLVLDVVLLVVGLYDRRPSS